MIEVFDIIGDKQPNSPQIHVDHMEKQELYKDYITECTDEKRKPCSMESFNELWTKSFSHYVKIRQVKSVSGKCYACGVLTGQRRRYRDSYRRGLVTECAALHRSTYMSERLV